MTVEELLAMFFLWVLATVVGLVLTGLLADRLVIRKIMENEDISGALEKSGNGLTKN